VTLQPSIGNWSLPCRSHYWIDHNRIRWGGAFNKEQISAVQAGDRHAAIAARPVRVSAFATYLAKLKRVLRAIQSWFIKH
jgi:hypothetical protein